MLSTAMGLGGGAEEQVMQLALALDTRGWTVRLVSMLPAHRMPPVIAERGIETRTLGMHPGVPDPRAIWRLAREVREFRPDVLHTHMTHGNLLGRVARMVEPVPVLVSTLHGMKMFGVTQRFTKFREWGHRWTDSRCDMTTAICSAAVESYRGSRIAPDHKLMTMDNGVDTTLYGPDPVARDEMRRELGVEGEFVWLAIGRLEGIKNFPMMFRAFREANDGRGVLLVCGGGSLREELEFEAATLGLTGRVRLLGIRGDIPRVMNAADAYVMSSDTEGLPMVLLQASATGLPIASTNVGGNAEVVRDGDTGFLSPPGNTDALTASMRRILAMSAGQRAAMGMAGRAHVVSKYDIRVIAARWESLYVKLLGWRGAPARGRGVKGDRHVSV